MSYRIRTLNSISARGLGRLPKDFQVGGDVDSPDALLVRSADLHKHPIPDTVLAVGRAGAGTNNIPVTDLSDRGVVVFNTPGANANAVKELVLAGLLLSARNLVPALAFARNLSGADTEIDAEQRLVFERHRLVGCARPHPELFLREHRHDLT